MERGIQDREDGAPQAHPAAEPEAFNWDRLMAVFAIGLSITAILVSVMEVSSARAHSRATVWPHLAVSTNYSSETVAIRVSNKGVGPALVKDAAFYLDGQLTTNLDAAILDTVGEADAFSYDVYRRSDLDNAVIAAGEEVDFFAVPLEARTRRLIEAWQGKADLALCYCSIQDDCWTTSLVSDDSTPIDNCRNASLAVSDTTPLQIRESDLQVMRGDPWTGTLSYLDFSSNTPTQIPVAADVRRVTPRTLVYRLEYPDEPDYNSTQKISISPDGTRIDGYRIVERGRADTGQLRIVTEGRSTDNNEAADVRFVYLIGARAFSIQQLVKPDGQAEFFERNRYSFTRG